MNDVVMPFRYPDEPHLRLHGPAGYSLLDSYRPWLRDEFKFRCVYCLKREQWGIIRRTYDIDHFSPQTSDPTAALEYDNLLYSCASCNSAKRGARVPDPARWLLERDVAVDEDGSLIGNTPNSARLIRVLGLDSPEYREFRRLWIGIVALAEKYQPALFVALMKYPDDLPDLIRLRPRENTRPDGIEQSCYARKHRGELPETY